MKFLVVGLGSMGKRRVRNLQTLGHSEVAGFDLRIDRCAETKGRYGILTYEKFEVALAQFRPDILIISTAPQHHMNYAFMGAKQGIHCFIEASVVEPDRIAELSDHIRGTGLVVAPSCTMRYFHGPRMVKELIRAGRIGRPLSFNYQTGQYLLDWHPWEKIQDFYVSIRETGGCREIVPFELTWLNDIFGNPHPLACLRGKISGIDADIDDIYCCLLRYPGGLIGNLTVEVLSRPKATRELRVIGTDGELVFSADEDCIRYVGVQDNDWIKIPLSKGTVESGYINPEEPYISELADFILAVEKGNPEFFPNKLEDDVRVLRLLLELEQLSKKPL